MSEADKITVSTLLATIKELEIKLRYEAESNAVLYANQFYMVDTIMNITAERDRLRADLEKVTAERITILCNIRRLMSKAWNKRTSNSWLIQELFGCGSGTSYSICKEFGIDPSGNSINRIQGGKK